MPLRPRAAVGASALAVLLSLLIAGSAFVAAQVAQPKANGATQKADAVEPPAALKTGVPIYSTQAAALASPVVVYTVRAPKLASNERLRIAGSVYPSYCNGADITGGGNAGSPCRNLIGTNGP